MVLMWNIRELMRIGLALFVGTFILGAAHADGNVQTMRLKDLGRIEAWRDNALTGYGLVTGLAGTGDSPRNKATRQSIANTLAQFDVNTDAESVLSRNAAAVMVTAVLPAMANQGDKLDITVTSLGDARSLLGGQLLLAPLKGPDGRIYAIAQGSLNVGGYQIDTNGNAVMKNHATTALVPNGATVERTVGLWNDKPTDSFRFVLFDADFTTAHRIAQAINQNLGSVLTRGGHVQSPNHAQQATVMATAMDASRIQIQWPESLQASERVSFITLLEDIRVQPDRKARVVVNERTGTVVAGGDVRIDKVSIAHGDLRINITTEPLVSQPNIGIGNAISGNTGIRTEVVPRTRIEVSEPQGIVVDDAQLSTVSALVRTLNRMRVGPRDVIAILNAMKAAGALRAELIVQ